MGYRSDVSVVFYSRNIEELPLASLKFWFDETYPKQDATEEYCAVVEMGHDFILVTYTDVKWYKDYRHVQAVRTILDSFCECFEANEIDGLGSFEMVEVGEEAGDIRETRSDYCDYRMGVTRLIEFC